jgi:hypothetical protein
VIAAKHKIYRALRRGELDARARRNGAGDVETIAPYEWLSLKFQSWNGHDLAVPIDIEKQPLKLPREIGDYAGGQVRPDVLPTVWPDPHFAAHQAMGIWPPHVAGQPVAHVESPVAVLAGSVAEAPPIDGEEASLRKASDEKIHEAVSAAYDQAVRSGQKPPNVKEVAKPAQAILRAWGYNASENRITDLAGDSRHNGRRLAVGKTWAREIRAKCK